MNKKTNNLKINKFKYGITTTLIIIFVLFLDLLTKALTDGNQTIIINGVLSFISSHNTGAAWSMLSNHTWLLVILSIVFLVVLVIINIRYKNKNIFYCFFTGLIFAGAIGNLIDRIFLGYVRDFISLDFINFPIFNIADCAITIGMVLLCVYVIFFHGKKKDSGATIQKN